MYHAETLCSLEEIVANDVERSDISLIQVLLVLLLKYIVPSRQRHCPPDLISFLIGSVFSVFPLESAFCSSQTSRERLENPRIKINKLR